ncbi:MAG: hypothetical protein IAI50_00480, partial [Candidatus Eremiobacteraeota bacterium]|nr:hypothetical protein [Candidatus Eremiobacteraeota bacterium]
SAEERYGGAKKSASTNKSAAKKKTTGGAKKKTAGRKYGPKASARVGEELHALEEGTLKSGSGQKVTSRKQAIAIGLSEARRSGAKVPPNPNAAKKSKS